MQYSLQKQKALGAFYTPSSLSEYLAKQTLSMKKNEKDKEYVVLDPAVGESALLYAFLSESKRKGLHTGYVGIDSEQKAINVSKEIFSAENMTSSFIHCDALYPCPEMKSVDGWTELSKKYFPNGIDFIVCNPPWGADKDAYKKLSVDFKTAKGQFDIYDLFIELCIRNLNSNGCFGFIVPDSIYNEEHKPVREFLFENTTIRQIVRLGEGIFPDINIAVSLIFGIKCICNNSHKISCAHLTNYLKNKVIRGEETLDTAITQCTCMIPSKMMVDNGYAFYTDITRRDSALTQILNSCQKISDVTKSQRGVELSKKGVVTKCPCCQKYFPAQRNINESIIKCPHCQHEGLVSSFSSRTIIFNEPTLGCKEIIVGEDVYRYGTSAKQYIELDIRGINYKGQALYHGPKILVRKTGVGITAGIDYGDCLTNQVVYILKRKNNIDPIVTNEVILAVLNSRIITYYIIKTMGSNGWKTHAYLSQKSVASLPFPNIDVNDADTRNFLTQITEIVRNNSKVNGDNFSTDADAKIEHLIAKLFGIRKSDYEVIYKAISEVQQMIPFKRLLKVSINEIFKNGI